MPLQGYSLTSWTQKDGVAPSLVWALAQDQDGYLWLGTDAGLLRFDGVRFVPWGSFLSSPNLRRSVRSLLAAEDGTIWFGLGEPGGVGAIAHGQVTLYGPAEGLPEGIVTSLVEGPDGIRAGGRFGLYRFTGTHWQDDDAGLPADVVSAMMLEPKGGLSVATAGGVYRRRSVTAEFERVGESTEPARGLARDGNGRLWATDPIVGWRSVQPHSAGPADSLQGRGSTLLVDSRGSLWIGTGGQGLWRYRLEAKSPAPLERTSTAAGLSDDGVTDLLEDRDGNVWVATRDGLNRLTPHKMTPITDIGLASAIEVAAGGDVFVGTAEGVVRFEDGRVEGRRPAIPLPAHRLAAMHADRAGTVWVATARQLMRLTHGSAEPVPLRGSEVVSLTDMTSDGADGLWLHDERRGLLHWRAGEATPFPLPSSLSGTTLLASYTDRRGRAWFTFEDSQVVGIDPSGQVQVYGPHNGLTAGPYRAVHEDPDGALWFGGSALTRYAGGVFTTLPPFAADGTQVITGIIDDSTRSLWVAISASGILRISGEELALSLADPRRPLRFRAYDKMDGSAGTSRWFGNRSAARSGSDRLWFVTGRGITVVDASALPNHSTPSADRVRIEGVVVDGHPEPVAPFTQLPARTARVQIDYTVLNLTAPHRTRFRYRLQGFDADWVDAGSRHSAFYTNLRPGDYTFQVAASGADGSFPDTTAAWPFSVRPMFYQTWWFALTCVAGVVVAIAGAWRVHVHRVRSQFVLLLKERARLSREVHDTLLQSMFGVALECDALQSTAPPHELELRERLRRLRRRVEADIREARQSIWNLRSPRLEEQDLASALREVGHQLLESTGVRFRFELDGTPRNTASDINEQLMRIGSEAIANVVRHADASEVVVNLSYHATGVTLTVSDDGRGFEAMSPAPHGHIGLTTMRERATLVGGTLRVETHPGAGTTVIAAVPSKAA